MAELMGDTVEGAVGCNVGLTVAGAAVMAVPARETAGSLSVGVTG